MMKELLEPVLNGDKNEVTLPQDIIPSKLVDYMESIGYEHEIETNGWDVDFWINFDNGKQGFVYSGSWYYGGQHFSVDDDYEDKNLVNENNTEMNELSNEVSKNITEFYKDLDELENELMEERLKEHEDFKSDISALISDLTDKLVDKNNHDEEDIEVLSIKERIERLKGL